MLLVLLLAAPPASAGEGPLLWPPREAERGSLYVHYGEEHWNDVDGRAVLETVLRDVIAFRPALVTAGGDKARDGTTEELTVWRDIHDVLDRAGIPYMAGIGNHDGKQQTPEDVTNAAAGSTPLRDSTFFEQVFAVRPYPFGDAAPYPGIGPARPADDPPGASTHYHVDHGPARFVFLDSSCFGIQNCDGLQNPPDGRGRSQFQYLRDTAAEAQAAGKAVFVVTHMPTQDPRDQEYAETTSRNHVMGKGVSPDNQLLEIEARDLGVDGVLLGHIKGLFQYRGLGDVPYYIDGGAGGELYTTGPRGVDHGYWYGFRLLRVVPGGSGSGGAASAPAVETDVVPVFAPNGVRLEGPAVLKPGGTAARFLAFGRQPASTPGTRGVIENLELRDPDPVPKGGGELPAWVLWLAPFALLGMVPLLASRRRGLVPVAVALPLAVAGGAWAQQSEPTRTPREALPNPARIFTTSDPRILAPVATDSDDPRRDRATQTADGTFAPRCPGHARVWVTSGTGRAWTAVRVASQQGALASIRGGERRWRFNGRARDVAAVRLAQPAVVEARVVRAGRVVKVLRDACLPAGTHRIRWTGRGVRRGSRARLEVRVRSDRPTVVRRYTLRVR